MKQLVLDPDKGSLTLAEVPLPVVAPGRVLVRVARSVVSTGTELMKLHTAKQPLWEKARSRPDQVAQVLQSVRTDGVLATMAKVRERLATPQPLGYSLAGIVAGAGVGCEDLESGSVVACAGGTASHAEYVLVPKNLAVRVPPGVRLEDAAFTTIGAIAMHGLRTGGVALGDRVLIVGLGLIGQIATRLCAAAGAHVFGVDPRADRTRLALQSGAEAAETALDRATAQGVMAWSGGRGADLILVTAGGADNSPLVLAGEAARDRARVVVVGLVDLDVPRELYYMKELSLTVSRSYGPGRYDPEFEEKGFLYPPGFVPWDERRNMAEFLTLLASNRLSLDGLRGMALPFHQAPEGYASLTGATAPISLVLEYGVGEAGAGAGASPRPAAPPRDAREDLFQPRALRVSMVGVGNFATASLLPAVRAVPGVTLVRAVASTPLRAEAVRHRWGFASAGAAASEAWASPDSDVVFIATRHDSHARLAEEALREGRAVFVEKPLALDEVSLERVETVLRATAGRLMVGFNRRFAPSLAWALEALGAHRAGLRFLCRVNAGALPPSHWLLDPAIGGGRLLGEVCHFLDLACFVAGSPPTEVQARALDSGAQAHGPQSYRVEIAFANGATAGIDYLAGGALSLAKERIEIHRSGVSIVLEDFKSATVHRGGTRQVKRWPSRDKGHASEIRAFL
ncbi:MAG TPA: bi-domain-containing oxidoreductase, partial [Candidatus Saccharimonadales bacterium]|nr:bi-domain-containing oxidoreductase [Candidatus Saccharimonadales bacterium]